MECLTLDLLWGAPPPPPQHGAYPLDHGDDHHNIYSVAHLLGPLHIYCIFYILDGLVSNRHRTYSIRDHWESTGDGIYVPTITSIIW